MFNIGTYTTRKIPLDELPEWSPWPARLLGLEEWTTPVRDVAKVDSQYDKDEYLRCLKYVEEKGDTLSPHDVRMYEMRLPRENPFCVSQKGALYELPSEKIMEANTAALLDTLEPLLSEVDTVVELGCGYGHNLWELQKRFPKKKYIGGEYSQNAVTLAGMLYASLPNLTVEQFNFYDEHYRIFDTCDENARILVFTRHAIEQLPSAAQLLQSLTPFFDRLTTVVHLEVALANFGDSLLDLLRKKYVEANDYNRDIVQLLQQRTDIEILRNDPDEFGINPLNPSSVITWKPKI